MRSWVNQVLANVVLQHHLFHHTIKNNTNEILKLVKMTLLELRESNENLSDGLKNSTRIAKCKFHPRGAKPRGAGIAFCLSDEGGIFQSMTKIFRHYH